MSFISDIIDMKPFNSCHIARFIPCGKYEKKQSCLIRDWV